MDLAERRRVFLDFGSKQVETGDFDTVHPLYLELLRDVDDPERRLWACILYMTWYNDASAWWHWKNNDPWTLDNLRPELHVCKNRRVFYGRHKLVEHLEHLCGLVREYGSGWSWLTHNFDGDPNLDWDTCEETLRTVRFNGVWASYTGADMLQKVAGVPIKPYHIGSVSSPVRGMEALLISNDTALEWWSKNGGSTSIPYDAPFDLGVLESLLCDFTAFTHGRFYSGRSIDRIQQRTLTVEEQLGEELPEIWTARERAFDRRYLGEFNGWVGIDKPRLRLFAEEGEIPWGYENR